MNSNARPFTLARANALLAQAGIRMQLRAEDTGRLKRLEPLSRIVNAFTRASRGDAGARQWILNTLQHAAIQNELPLSDPTSWRSAQPSPQVRHADHGKPVQTLSTDSPISTRDHNPDQRPESEHHTQKIEVLVRSRDTTLRVVQDDRHATSSGVVIEAASGSNGRNVHSKLRLELSETYLPIVTAALLGYMGHCVCDKLGAGNDSGLEIRNQGRRAIVRLWTKDHPLYTASIGPIDLYALTALLIRQLRVAKPWLDGATMSLLLKSVGNRAQGRLSL